MTARLVAEHRRALRHREQRERSAAREDLVETRLGEGEESFVLRCVRELPEPYRAVVELRYLEERSIEEISKMLRRPRVTVRSQLKRGLDQLRARVHADDSSLRSLLGIALARLFRHDETGGSRRGLRPGLAAVALGAALLTVPGWSSYPDRGTRRDARQGPVGTVFSSADEVLRATGSLHGRAPVLPAGGAAVPERLDWIVRTPTGEPLAGATVWTGRADGGGRRSVALSGPGGRFQVSGAAIDELVWAEHPDWCASRRQYVRVGSGRDLRELFLTGAGGHLGLRVLSPEGEPVSGAQVVLDPLSLDSGASLSRVGALECPPSSTVGTTAADGTLVVPRPEDGEVAVRVLAEGHPPLCRRLGLDGSTTDLDLVLPRPATIAGRVADELGLPAWRAAVEVRQLLELPEGEQLRKHALTDADGSFEVSGLASGRYLLVVVEDPDSGSASCVVEGEIVEGARRPVELVLSARHTLSGRAQDGAAFAGGLARLTPRTVRGSTYPSQAQPIGPSGTFAFAGCLPEISYRLELFPPGDPLARGWIEDVHAGEGEALVATDVRGETPVVLEFQADEERLLPCLVELRDDSPPLSVLAPVDPGGRASFPALPVRRFLIVPYVQGLGTWRVPILDAARTEPVHHVRVPRPGRLSGCIQVPKGTSVSDIKGFLVIPGFHTRALEGSLNKRLQRELAIDEYGCFDLELFPGDYECFLSVRGCTGTRRSVRIEEGATTQVTFDAWLGRELRVALRTPRLLHQGERVMLEARTPGGSAELPYTLVGATSSAFAPAGTELRVVIRVEDATSEIRAWTNKGLEGLLALAPGFGEGAGAMEYLQIPLRDDSLPAESPTDVRAERQP